MKCLACGWFDVGGPGRGWPGREAQEWRTLGCEWRVRGIFDGAWGKGSGTAMKIETGSF